ncbi:uncharacterized protein LOC142974215 [Anticarsia gemmatalis]|uniref:uncharacterized protein LOC142974215 n=1 Tax=Anticarsia gemmatalis TaxID=129554 RepID=UPI003F771356
MTIVLSGFTRIMMFEILWYRVRKFRKYLQNNLSELKKLDNVEYVNVKLKSCMLKYKLILDIVDNTSASTKVLPTLPTLYEMWIQFILACIPALFIELSKREVSAMTMYLGRQLLLCKDNNLREAINECIVFLKHRPFQLSVFRLFSYDLGMVISMVGLCLNYTIAMLQFSHFLD